MVLPETVFWKVIHFWCRFQKHCFENLGETIRWWILCSNCRQDITTPCVKLLSGWYSYSIAWHPVFRKPNFEHTISDDNGRPTLWQRNTQSIRCRVLRKLLRDKFAIPFVKHCSGKFHLGRHTWQTCGQIKLVVKTATDRETKTLQIPRIHMNTLGITRGPYLVNVALLSEALILDVIPFWYDVQKQ